MLNRRFINGGFPMLIQVAWGAELPDLSKSEFNPLALLASFDFIPSSSSLLPTPEFNTCLARRAQLQLQPRPMRDVDPCHTLRCAIATSYKRDGVLKMQLSTHNMRTFKDFPRSRHATHSKVSAHSRKTDGSGEIGPALGNAHGFTIFLSSSEKRMVVHLA